MIKICGITNENDAVAAADAGATAIGFNFYPGSPRYIEPEVAAAIGKGLTVLRVGVFVDAPAAEIEAARIEANLDVIQLHGGESPTDVPDSYRTWKAFRVSNKFNPEDAARYNVEAILLDGPLPGTGQAFDWTLAKGMPQRLILAGGLDENNVADAIRVVQPWGIDACSKLETAPGIKDHEKVRRFIQAAMATL